MCDVGKRHTIHQILSITHSSSGLFSVALSLAPLSPAASVGVTHHRVLSCSDFPRVSVARTPAVACPRHADIVAARCYALHVMADHRPEVTVWTDATRAALLSSVLDLMGESVTPIGVGGPRGTEVDRLAKSSQTMPEDDLRKLLVDKPAAFLLLGTMTDVTPDDLIAAVRAGTMVLTLEPVATELRELDAIDEALDGIFLVPAFLRSPGLLRATDPRGLLGTHRTLAYHGGGPADTASLFARLYDAWATVLSFTLLPETVDASLVTPESVVPSEPRKLTGTISAHARIPDDTAAVVQVTDAAGTRRRTLDVLGDAGQLRVSDTGYDLFELDGSRLDHHDESSIDPPFADLIVAQWRRLIDVPTRLESGPAPQDILACCLATLLSARTGQPERPDGILQMRR